MIAMRVALVAALLSIGVAPGAEASVLPGYCPDAGGITVIVDFQELGGASIVRCAPGDQSTGLAALKNAGIPIAGTARWGESYICRVDGKPGPDTEPCITTPPASAHWSYWYATDGGSWKISEAGVTARKPPAGSFEGWSFSLNKSSDPPPRLAPRRPAPAAPPPPAAPPAPRKPQPGNNPPPATPPVTTSASPTETVPPASSAPVSSAVPVSSTGGVSWTGEVEQAAAQGSSGPSAGLLIGVAIIVLLAGGAAGITVRRKRAARRGD
jgi:hypothetical protein